MGSKRGQQVQEIRPTIGNSWRVRNAWATAQLNIQMDHWFTCRYECLRDRGTTVCPLRYMLIWPLRQIPNRWKLPLETKGFHAANATWSGETLHQWLKSKEVSRNMHQWISSNDSRVRTNANLHSAIMSPITSWKYLASGHFDDLKRNPKCIIFSQQICAEPY